MSMFLVDFDVANLHADSADRRADEQCSNNADAVDVLLLRQLEKGDETAMRQLIDRHGDMLNRLVGRLTGWHAERDDILQEVLVCVWQKAGEYRAEGSFEGWLRSIAINRCRNHFRAVNTLKRMIEKRIAFQRAATAAEGSDVEKNDTGIHLRHVLQRLPQRDRTVLALYYLEEIPGEQVAKLLQITQQTLHVRLHRARTRLKNLIESDYDNFV